MSKSPTPPTFEELREKAVAAGVDPLELLLAMVMLPGDVRDQIILGDDEEADEAPEGE